MVENLLHNQCLWICLHTENLPAKVIQNPRIYVKVLRETVQYAWLKKKNRSFMKPFTLEKGSIMPKCDAVLTLWQADEQVYGVTIESADQILWHIDHSFLNSTFLTFESQRFKKRHEWKILTTYRSDVLDICGHSIQSSRFKLFTVRWSEVYFPRFAFLTIKNHVQLSPRVVYLPKTERDCWTSTTKDSTLKKFPSNNALG